MLVGRLRTKLIVPAALPHAGQQPVGAADDFDLFVAEGIHGAGDDAPVIGQADAVDLRVGDVKAARGERGAVGLPLVDDDAGAQAQRFVEIAGAEIAHLLGGHDADGLRRFLDVQIQPGRPAAHPVLALLDNRHLLQRRLDGRTRLGPCGAHQGRLHDQRHECDGAHDGAEGMGVHGRQFPGFQQMGIIIISICKKHCRANAAPAAMHASELLFL